ncbi:plastocyanin/azurin family copper-binding protein [Halobacterium yunchengense]|uniref:plastocyanin/azurin family copper-binding protein n=1 Tax=Halobacterium yunchengense TaxID=3108497 RepID=UPI0030090B0A
MTDDTGERVTRRRFLRTGAGVAAAGVAATGSAAAQEDGGGGSTEITVGPGGSNVFDPETAYVEPGGTVKWVWDSGGHNVAVESTPDGAEWTGHEPIEDAGFEYEHTFETEGTYEYVCTPHASVGMTGVVEVTTDPPEEPQGYQSILPNSAKTLGVAAVGSMTSVLGLTYFFMRYGGDYGEGDHE